MRNDGGPAFPQSLDNTPATSAMGLPSSGMSLRDYFAAAAVTGMIANTSGRTIAARVRLAWEYADAMLAERDRPKPPLEVTEEHREQGATDLQRAYPERRP